MKFIQHGHRAYMPFQWHLLCRMNFTRRASLTARFPVKPEMTRMAGKNDEVSTGNDENGRWE
ncbi:MAG: hypothetical protein ACI395_01510 [Candidatus Cryptobacteroides sp.]